MNLKKNLLKTFVLLVVSSVAFAQTVTLENVCSKLAEHPNMKGDFSQVKTIKKVNRSLKSSGKFIFSLDGIMWKTEKPFPSSIVVGMTSIVQTMPDGSKNVIDASSNQIFGSIATTLSSIFSGNIVGLQSNFDVSFSMNGTEWTAELLPKDDAVLMILKKLTVSGTYSFPLCPTSPLMMPTWASPTWTPPPDSKIHISSCPLSASVATAKGHLRQSLFKTELLKCPPNFIPF